MQVRADRNLRKSSCIQLDEMGAGEVGFSYGTSFAVVSGEGANTAVVGTVAELGS